MKESEREMNAKISASIVKNIQAGMGIQAAVDAVLGAGAYMKLAGEIYDALRAVA